MKRVLITSALPYINGIKHLGNLAGSMLPADVFARHNRRMNRETLFICATDEHGTPAELAAAKVGIPVEQYCAGEHRLQADLARKFSISWDHFGRSSSKQNHKLTTQLATKLIENGYVEKRMDRLWFSIDDDRFLPDRYIVGTCPKCAHPMARGDQCDACGALLEPSDLGDPSSAVSGSKNLELRDTEHLYLKLSALEPKVREWVDARADNWSALTRGIAYKHLDEGLRDRGITRDLKWGIKVPGMEDKVFYVWFDAPIEYISATIEHLPKDWERWWKAGDEVHYVQVMGKDNVPFHTTSFPATILGSGENLKTVDHLKGLNWLNWNGGKFSTSEERGLFMDEALALFPADYWRWYLSIHAPEGSDTAFMWDSFATTVNSDLADTIGNLVNRVVGIANKGIGSESAWSVPSLKNPVDSELFDAVDLLRDQMFAELDAFEISKAAKTLRAIWSLGNGYIQKTHPWKQFYEPKLDGENPSEAYENMMTDRWRGLEIVQCIAHFIHYAAELSEPFIPDTSRALMAQFRDLKDGHYKEGFGIVKVFFEKITPERLAELKEAYP